MAEDLKRLIELDPEVDPWDYWQPGARATAPGPPLSQVGSVSRGRRFGNLGADRLDEESRVVI